jgi:hypothetical protein
MDKWIYILVIICFIFILTYDPKTKNLEKVISVYGNPQQDPNLHYQNVQFVNQDVNLGAIIHS